MDKRNQLWAAQLQPKDKCYQLSAIRQCLNKQHQPSPAMLPCLQQQQQLRPSTASL
jgi:hypothetical protein